MDGVVLVLNQNYEPLNVCNLPRAFRLVFGEKAEVIEYDHQVIRTVRTEYRAPSVIRLQHLNMSVQVHHDGEHVGVLGDFDGGGYVV